MADANRFKPVWMTGSEVAEALYGSTPQYATDNQITDVIRQLGEDQALRFSVRDVKRGYNSWSITLEATKGSMVIRTTQCSVSVPARKTEQEVYDGLKPYMEQIIGKFIDIVMGELRRGESSESRTLRDAIVFVTAGPTPSMVARPQRRIEEL